ncbi:hypothetical protein OS493_019871 [Desmophyllum pertusum]|uniref:Ubiquitin-like protease family profile domain-containing protein n=1 Tax=Desmophyllum pertusum TaxID=174260 RepID=A0A9W9YMX0_9CNID|nr:hypothetical protein OS493_019871 [Desmophyllum pertusum]
MLTVLSLLPHLPQQENGYDCGVFVLLFFEEFLKRKFPIEDLMSGEILCWYSQDSAPNYWGHSSLCFVRAVIFSTPYCLYLKGTFLVQDVLL